MRGHGVPRAVECSRAAPAVRLAPERDCAIDPSLSGWVALVGPSVLDRPDLQINARKLPQITALPPDLLEVAAHVCVAVRAALRPAVRLLHWCERGGERDGDGDGDGDVHAVCLSVCCCWCAWRCE
jgi:hypothetical protein